MAGRKAKLFFNVFVQCLLIVNNSYTEYQVYVITNTYGTLSNLRVETDGAVVAPILGTHVIRMNLISINKVW